MYEAIMECLEAISNNTEKNWDNKYVTEAHRILHAITSDSFIVTFQTNLYLATRRDSALLQGSELTAFEDVELVKEELSFIRDNAEMELTSVYHAITQMAEVSGKEPGIPGRCARRVNVQAEMPEYYWRIAVFIPFL